MKVFLFLNIQLYKLTLVILYLFTYRKIKSQSNEFHIFTRDIENIKMDLIG
jgi:hypothetical protein